MRFPYLPIPTPEILKWKAYFAVEGEIPPEPSPATATEVQAQQMQQPMPANYSNAAVTRGNISQLLGSSIHQQVCTQQRIAMDIDAWRGIYGSCDERGSIDKIHETFIEKCKKSYEKVFGKKGSS